MVQAAHASPGDHLPAPYRESPTPGCLLIQSEVRAVVVVVREVIGEESLQMSLVQGNDLVEQFASAASDPTLRDAVLPRALDGGLHARDLHGSNRSRDFQSILRVVVKDEELGRGLIREGCAHLLDNPSAGRMRRDIEVQNASTVVADDEEAVEYVECKCRDREEIHREAIAAYVEKPANVCRGLGSWVPVSSSGRL